MAGLHLNSLILTLNILLVVLFAMANMEFCGSVFETQVGECEFKTNRSGFLVFICACLQCTLCSNHTEGDRYDASTETCLPFKMALFYLK